ncbi:Glycolate oxidase subunit GlcD [Planctomycetales bacterium 10988]|nr:Glycolate oxidase subunit GlcD [Planctomycetales bacterium 10988]
METLSQTSSLPLLEAKFTELLGKDRVLTSPSERLVYECDGFTLEKNIPDLVVLPETTEEVVAIVKLCNEYQVPFLPRGAGTSLAGGCFPFDGGVMIVLTRMKKIIELQVRDRYAVVQPGVINSALTRALQGTGYHYAPDPSSQIACTIGGNVATNSGGPHTLKYGVTVNHILGLEIVLHDGSILELGGPTGEQFGPDLISVFVGSEGTFGICTKVWVRLTPDPEARKTVLAVFDDMDNATEAISEIIGQGIIPAAMEMMDQGITQAVEEAFHFGFPTDAKAVVIIEIDGLQAGLQEQQDAILKICQDFGAREVRHAQTEAERLQIWQARKKAFGAIGRLSSSFCTQDGVVPRTKLPEMLRQVAAVSEKYGLRIVNVFHAGDGNIHPILLFDERDEEQVRQVLEASDEILETCLDLGGTVTGEHGIGIEKLSFMPRMFTETDLAVMKNVKEVFNPSQLLSPKKKLPSEDIKELKRLKPGRHAPH